MKNVNSITATLTRKVDSKCVEWQRGPTMWIYRPRYIHRQPDCYEMGGLAGGGYHVRPSTKELRNVGFR